MQTIQYIWCSNIIFRSQAGIVKRGFLSPSHNSESPPIPTIKIEKKEADLKVFLGPENIFPAENPFSPKHPCAQPELSLNAKSRLSKVSSLFEKLQKLSEVQPQEEEAQPKTEKKSLTPVLAKATKEEEPKDSIEDESPVKVLTTIEPKVYVSSVQSIIDRLNAKVSEKSGFEDSDNRSISFLNVLKSINRGSDVDKLEDESIESSSSSSLETSFEESEILKRISIGQVSGQKDETSMQELLKIVKIKHLFKCMAKTECSFSSDNAAKFRLHLEEVHSIQKSKLRHGWLRCSCCLKKLGSPSRLVSHVIKDHGSSTFQCPHCLFREATYLGILLHQQTSHPGKPPGYIDCKGFKKSEQNDSSEMFKRSESQLMMKCREKNCPFETRSKVEMSNHLFVEHSGDVPSYSDFCCFFCDAVFTSSARLVSQYF